MLLCATSVAAQGIAAGHVGLLVGCMHTSADHVSGSPTSADDWRGSDLRG